jgi:hypothetical protein
MNTTFTTAAFERSHGRKPRGRGEWGFQQSASHRAFFEDLTGEMQFFRGTLTEAKAQAVAAGMTGIVAVLP